MPREYSTEERLWLVEIAYEALITVLEQENVLSGDDIKKRIMEIIEMQGGDDETQDNQESSEMQEMSTNN